MRQLLAALIDAALTALAGYLGFRIALWAAPCDGHPGNCFVLVPLTILLILAGLSLYFGLGYRVFGCTLGRRLLRIE